MGAVYHTVVVKSFRLSAPLVGLQNNPSDLVGYVVARIPMNAASNGALGPVIVAGQWQLPWTSLIDAPTLARWSSAEGGPLKLDEFPSVALTLRNAVDTRLLSRDESASTYMCTIVADITVNGITTERVIQRATVAFTRSPAADSTIKGEQLTLRAKWQVRLSDFFSSLPGVAVMPTIDLDADLLMSTVSPDGQQATTDTAPVPQDSIPASGEPESPSPSPPGSAPEPPPTDAPPKTRK